MICPVLPFRRTFQIRAEMNNQEAAEADIIDIRSYREDAVTLLSAVRRTLAELLRKMVEGEDIALRDLAAKQAELESALKRVFDAESRFHEWMQRNSGAGDGAIDLDAARVEIGRRLDRLRDAGGTG